MIAVVACRAAPADHVVGARAELECLARRSVALRRREPAPELAVAAANAFLATLGAEQRARVKLPFERPAA